MSKPLLKRLEAWLSENHSKTLETTVRTLEADLYENAAISDNEAYAELYNRINEGFPKVIKMNYRS